MRHSSVAVLLLILASTPLATADEPPEAWYVQAGGAVFHQSGASNGEWVVSVSAPGGTTFGFELAAGRRVSRLVSMEIEGSRTGLMEATEPSRYNMTFLVKMRDTAFSLNGRFHVRLSPVVEFEPVVGVGLMHERAWTESVDGSSSDRGDHGPGAAPSVSAGAALRFGERRMALMTSFRARWTFWGHAFDDSYDWYVPPAKTQLAFGLAARVSF